jgi:hypothetical protein
MRIPIESSTSYRGRNARPNWLILAAFIGAALAAGALGAVFSPGFSAPTGHWYAMLAKPAWAPPINWFAPVWTVLYALMGTSAWLVWHERYHRGRSGAGGLRPATPPQCRVGTSFFRRQKHRRRFVRDRRAVGGDRLDHP